MSKKFKDDLAIADMVSKEAYNGLFEVLELKTPAARIYLRFALANARLMDRKQQEYGCKNISAFGVFGVVVKMTDKFERLKHLFGMGRRAKTINESIEDSFRDVSNYGVIALMVERGEWPNE